MMNSTRPRFSVIIPCFNRTVFLEQAITSVLNQTVTSFEIIVIDDGSNDKAAREIASICSIDDRIRLIRKNENKGVSSARNMGLQDFKGDYVCFLDDDDRIAPAFFQYALDSFDQQTGIDIALVRSIVDPESEKSRLQYHALKINLKAQLKYRTYTQRHPNLLYQYLPQINSLIFRKNVFDQFRFQESLQIGEDIYLWFQLLEAGFTFGEKQSKESLAFIRVHNEFHLSQRPHLKIIDFLKRLRTDFGPMDPVLETLIDFKLFMRYLIMGSIKVAILILIKSMKRPVAFFKIASFQSFLKAKVFFSYVLFRTFNKDL